MKGIQAKTAKMIAGVFKIISGAILDAELFLLSMKNHLDVVLYDSMLRVTISFAYPFIKIQRQLSNRQLILGQSQYQNMLYVELTPFHKLEMRYAAVFNRDIDKLKTRTPFAIASWWKPLSITIAGSDTEAFSNHDAILAKGTYLTIYTDGSGIGGEVGASAVTLFASIADEPLMMADKLQAHLKPFTDYTIYSEKLINLQLVLEIIEQYPHTSVAIFTDSQAAIQAIRRPKSQSGQYILRELAQRIAECGNEIEIH